MELITRNYINYLVYESDYKKVFFKLFDLLYKLNIILFIPFIYICFMAYSFDIVVNELFEIKAYVLILISAIFVINTLMFLRYSKKDIYIRGSTEYVCFVLGTIALYSLAIVTLQFTTQYIFDNITWAFPSQSYMANIFTFVFTIYGYSILTMTFISVIYVFISIFRNDYNGTKRT